MECAGLQITTSALTTSRRSRYGQSHQHRKHHLQAPEHAFDRANLAAHSHGPSISQPHDPELVRVWLVDVPGIPGMDAHRHTLDGSEVFLPTDELAAEIEFLVGKKCNEEK
jgi:hypothetical protein